MYMACNELTQKQDAFHQVQQAHKERYDGDNLDPHAKGLAEAALVQAGNHLRSREVYLFLFGN